MSIDQFMQTLQVGQECNVRREGEPMVRVVTKVEVRKERGEDWLYWYWVPKGATPNGTRDCGFGGLAIEYHRQAA